MPTAGLQTFGTPHLIVMVLTVAVPALLSGVARRARSKAAGKIIGYCVAGGLLINEVTHWGYRITEFGLDQFVQDHLPLHACGVAVLATAATLFSKNQRTYEIAYFWGLAGATNAVVTPNGIELAFPGYRFFQYFLAHSGIVVGVLFATWGLRMRPTLGGLFRAFASLNLYAIAIAGINVLLGTNYLYLSQPPAGTITPFFFAPWPWYILTSEVIGLAMFFVVYSPFAVARLASNRRREHRG